LYERLLRPEQLPPGLLRDLANFQWDAPTLKLNWALNGAIPWTAPAARGAGTVHLGVDMDGLTRYAADLATRQFPKQPFVVLGQMTTSDATRSPAGTESAWAYTHVPVSASQDESAIAAHARLVEQTIERHAPGFAELIQAQVVQSPRQLEAENPSLVGGSINGGTSQIHQQLVFRPVPGLGGAATPVDRLFLGSASAHPGGGVHGGPGANAAQAALARDRMFGSGRRRLYQLAAKRLYGPNSARAVTQTTQGARTTQS
jgi:phytoene dehydrogenase-like protein